MASKILLAAILAVTVISASVNAQTATKAGTCPVTDGVGTCANMCNSDQDCSGDLKCCSNGCGTACSKPVTDTVKAGCCPKASVLSKRQCSSIRFAVCKSDSECKDALKCCDNGCGSQSCAKPAAPKSGTCPVPPNWTCIWANYECRDDCTCPGDQKCCATGLSCGASCKPPAVPTTKKPGVCPTTFSKGTTPAADCRLRKCASDSECASRLKCCSNSCGGLACTPPS